MVIPELSAAPQEVSPKSSNPRKMAFAVVGVLIILLLSYFLYFNFNSGDAPVEAQATFLDKSIVVLPFTNLSSDPEQDYFSDGMMEEILNHLVKIQDLKVISRTTAMQFKGTSKSVNEITKELNVATALEGSVRKDGDKIRITVQLIEGATDTHLWSESYDRELTDIFDVQSDVAQLVAQVLQAEIGPEVKLKIQSQPTSNPEAYNLYLMGRHFWYQRTKEGLKKSIDYFEQSMAIDPNYALAYAGLADAYLISVAYGHLPQDKGFPKAKEYALRALEIDPNLAQAYATLGTIANREWRWEEAEAKLKRSIGLDPNYIMARHWYAEYLFVFGPPDKLLEQINIGLRLDPLSFLMQSQLAWYYYNEGELGRALEEYKTLLELDPLDLRGSHFGMFKIYVEQGKEEEAFNSLMKNWAVHNYMEGQVHLAEDIYKRQGMKGLFSWLIEFEVGNPNAFPPWVAELYLLLGEKELALDWLEKSYESRPMYLPAMITGATYESLRSEPRYIELLKKMGMTE